MRKLGLFGGTFDPIHIGHIKLAERVLREFSLDEIVFIPAGNPPHKTDRKTADKAHRFNMVQLAVKDFPEFSVSDFEMRNDKPNYSYITISYFKEKYPNDEIYFIIGGDSFRDFPKWKNYRTLLTLCTFIVVSRPGVAASEYFEKYRGDEAPPRVLFLNGVSYDVSSTKIREYLSTGSLPPGQVPISVENYIKTNKLYI